MQRVAGFEPLTNEVLSRKTMPEKNVKKITAGDFAAWLIRVRNALRTQGNLEVPCGDCIACCTSSYFVHIKSYETASLSRIPKELRFNAPGVKKGDIVLGYKQDGSCPMLVEGRCSIYAYRPQTCRLYDCRILCAAGLRESSDKPMINERVHRWRFELSSELSKIQSNAVRTAAAFLDEYKRSFPSGFVPANPIQKAVLAVKIYKMFLRNIARPHKKQAPERIKEIVDDIMAEYEGFESSMHRFDSHADNYTCPSTD